jgi:hypothetical protein
MQQRERALGQRLHHQHVDVAAFDHSRAASSAVVGETRAAADADRAGLARLHLTFL